MLQAPVNEAKSQDGHAKRQRTPLPERERYPLSLEAPGHLSLAGNGNSIPPSAAARSRSAAGTLQRLYGNQAVLQMRNGSGGLPPAPSVPSRPSQSRILQRKCACGDAAGMSGECEECSKKKRLGLQTKLKVNEPGDIYEQEADRIADQVLATPAHPAVSGAAPRIQRFAGRAAGPADVAPASVDQALASPGRPLEPALRRDMEQRFGYDFSRVRVHSGAAAEQSARDVSAHAYSQGRQDEQHLQMKPAAPSGTGLSQAPPIVHEVLNSPGQPLDTATRTFMEPRFGQDFSQVRVHTDTKADESARAVQARAYTVGRDMVFGAGQFAPRTRAGQRLLSHELAHVVQQERGAPLPSPSGRDRSKEASNAAASPVVSGRGTVHIGGASALRLCRQPQLTGSGITLTPPQPRSLHGSLDAGSFSSDELVLEIKLIQQWLDAHPERNQQSDNLRSELKDLQSELQLKTTPFQFRFYYAWYHAKEASLKEVYQWDKAYHGSSIGRGLIHVEELVPSPEDVWKYGIAGGLFTQREKKHVNEWSEDLASQTFDKRYKAAKYGRIHDEDYYGGSGQYRDDDKNIWARGEEYNLFLPSEKAAVLRIPLISTTSARLLIDRINRVDPNSLEAAKLIDEIHDFTSNPAVVLLGPEVGKLLGPFGYTYESGDAGKVAHQINRAYQKSVGDQCRKDSNASTKERWDESLTRRGFGKNNLEAAEFDENCFQSEHEFNQEVIRRAAEFREHLKDCGLGRPSRLDCRNGVFDEYFPAGKARHDAIIAWAQGEMEIYEGVLGGGVASQLGFHFAQDVLGWSSARSAAFSGTLSTVTGLGFAAAERRASLRNPAPSALQPPTPIGEMVEKPEPMRRPDQPAVQVAPPPAVTDVKPAAKVVTSPKPPAKPPKVTEPPPEVPKVEKPVETPKAEQPAEAPKVIEPPREAPKLAEAPKKVEQPAKAAGETAPPSEELAPKARPASTGPGAPPQERIRQLADENQGLSNEAKAAEPKINEAQRNLEKLNREADKLANELSGTKAVTKEAVKRNPDLKGEYDRVKQLRKLARETEKQRVSAANEYARLKSSQDARYSRIRDNKAEIERQRRPELTLAPTPRGRANELRVLKEEGLLGPKQSFTAFDAVKREWATTIPDGMRPNGRTVDVKDVAKLSETQQLRLQREVSRRSGQKAEIITGTETDVPPEMERTYLIMRRPDLGPQ